MLSYTHFTHDERISLHNFLKEGLGIREIARRLGRDPSTISREVKRNSSSKSYHHRRAQVLTICRRRQQRRTALKPGLRSMITRLKSSAICGRLKRSPIASVWKIPVRY